MGFFAFVVQSAAYFFSKELGSQSTLQSAANASADSCHSSVQFSSHWDVLGPFQIGTREAAWGVDPLEYYGGFSDLKPNASAAFPSSITRDGRARWSPFQSSQVAGGTGNCDSLHLSFAFPHEVDWRFLQNVYGWPASQWQAWARGTIDVHSNKDETVLLYTDHILEYAVDGQRSFGGDFFAFRKAPAVLRLAPGKHIIDVRLVRDVRAMGGAGAPSLDVILETIVVQEPGLFIGDVLLSDVVDGKLAAPYASVALTNTRDSWLVVSVASSQSGNISVEPATNRQPTNFILAPGQTRPFSMRLKLLDSHLRQTNLCLSHKVIDASEDEYEQVEIPIELRHQSKYDTHKVTHMHTSGIVSYAELRPPSANATCASNATAAAVMVLLHGAGVEADDPIAKEALAPLPNLCAWIMTPSGVTSWSSDDWHTWGWVDVESASKALPNWLVSNSWSGIGVDANKIVLIGHSNGGVWCSCIDDDRLLIPKAGQGVWYGLTHHPNLVVAAAPLSGYISIPWYVPTALWRPMDASKKAMLQFATASFHHDLMVSNFARTPIFQQHGDRDDNVPVFHSSLMHQLIAETGSSTTYNVIKNQGHWWPTVATEHKLAQFYQQVLKHPRVVELADVESFELVVADPGDTTGRFGVRVLYLQQQGMMGRLKVEYVNERRLWRFTPLNVMAFEIPDSDLMPKIEIDDGSRMMSFDCADTMTEGVTKTFWRSEENLLWTMTDPPYSPSRRHDHFGGLSAILRSKNGPITINSTSSELSALALQVSRNLHTYFGADTIIILEDVGESQMIASAASIVLSVGDPWPLALSKGNSSLRIGQHGERHVPERLHSSGQWRAFPFRGPQGAAFLRPRADRGLEAVVWGSDVSMVEQMARLLPMMTGTGQPDWIVCSREMMWKGVEGCELGWFDAWWWIQE